jgi:hypothetical protein
MNFYLLQLFLRRIGTEAQLFQTALVTIFALMVGAAIFLLAATALHSGGSLNLQTVFFHLEVHGH